MVISVFYPVYSNGSRDSLFGIFKKNFQPRALGSSIRQKTKVLKTLHISGYLGG